MSLGASFYYLIAKDREATPDGFVPHHDDCYDYVIANDSEATPDGFVPHHDSEMAYLNPDQLH